VGWLLVAADGFTVGIAGWSAGMSGPAAPAASAPHRRGRAPRSRRDDVYELRRPRM